MSQKKQILKILSGGNQRTLSELHAVIGGKRHSVRGRLSELSREGFITKTRTKYKKVEK